MIPLQELFQRAIDVIEKAEIRYLVYGGIALPARDDTSYRSWNTLRSEETVQALVRALHSAS